MIDAADLRRRLTYDQNNGIFLWNYDERMSPQWNSRCAGKPAGGFMQIGYHRIVINYKLYLSHRLAWLWMTGEWPKEMIDHIDGNPANNAWCNLRQANKSQNAANSKISVKNSSGVPGVWRRPNGRWAAEYKILSKKVTVGTFDTLEEAAEERFKAYSKAHGEYARGSLPKAG